MMAADKRYCAAWVLRRYARALYILSLVLGRRRWQRASARHLRRLEWAQAGFAAEHADKLGLELRQAVKRYHRDMTDEGRRAQ